MFNQKSVLARLLANENITVQQGNFESAYFDVQSRTLGIPMWKSMSADIMDLLVGHEVSHALYTPSDFNKYMSEGIPHSWLNIVEDVRIEKKILRKYPGLVANFKRGYHELMYGDNDLFNIRKADIKKMNFMDRLNVHAKARDLVSVPFTDEEAPYVAQAKACETYEDVVQCCRDIQAWLKEKGDEADQQEQEVNIDPKALADLLDQLQGETDPSDEDPSDQDVDLTINVSQNEESDSEEDGEESKGSQTEETDGEGEESEEQSDSDGEESNEDSEAESTDDVSEGSELPSGGVDEEALTDIAQQSNQGELVEGCGKAYVKGLSLGDLDSVLIPHDVVAELRQERIDVMSGHAKKYGFGSDYADVTFPEEDYNQFMAETKRVVNLMVKEFEMRKAAYRSARARTSTRGTLDVNKLHKYKYEDNLFKQAMQLADAKNHGMLMAIDYSGSMHRMLPSVIKQTIALSMFCKRVGIPFEVYSFTSYNRLDDHEFMKKLSAEKDLSKRNIRQGITTFDFGDLVMCDLLNSSMKKRVFDKAIKMLFWQTTSRYRGAGTSSVEELGSTPLNAAIMACRHLIAKFRAKHAVEKMNFVTLTDGASDFPSITYGKDLYDQRNNAREWGNRWDMPSDYVVDLGGQTATLSHQGYRHQNARQFTTDLLKTIQTSGVNTINYYVAERPKDFTYEVRGIHGWDDAILRKARKELRENGVYTYDNTGGYSRRFILMNEQVSAEVEDLEVNSGMTVAQAARAFKKSSSSKKKSRVVTQKFAEIVA